ncbi:TRAP transporter small permease [Isoalcanivorax indicus]|uniref:TRAP transporter small permease n=1 Tax=Isoalcanivorax indicus TaxID=2202653 RepID=UPI000DB97893|nr:TRAP transporter small permease subunit [Isoalcanivorax indicus]
MGLIRLLHRFEDALIVLVLAGMILLAVLQILLRNFLGMSLTWIEPLLQNAVLWIGLLGAMIASRNDDHISVDALSHYLSETLLRWLAVCVDLFTCMICAVAGWYSLNAVRDEAEFGGVLLSIGHLDVQGWWLQIIIPLGFVSIALRYAVLTVLGVMGRRPALKKKPLVETGA